MTIISVIDACGLEPGDHTFKIPRGTCKDYIKLLRYNSEKGDVFYKKEGITVTKVKVRTDKEWHYINFTYTRDL